MSMLDKAKGMEDQLIAWRREIHMHPELGFEEERTSRLVAESLRDMGIEVEVGVAETGVVARIGEGRPPSGFAPIWTPCRFKKPTTCLTSRRHPA